MNSPVGTDSNQGTAELQAPKYKRKDFTSDQIVRWCPGCGDYSILAQMQKVMPDVCASLGLKKEDVVFVSGIGCSSRFPYYMDTFGFHSIHGRAPAIATGVKSVNPDLQVWVVTGDGDGLSIGGNHLLHCLRRNVDLKILLFNNRIYGLTKGQYSPTSELGKRTKSSPMGTVEGPVNPLRIALASEATFVARTLDTDTKHLQMVLERTAAHKGAAFVEIFQNCNVFNDGAFESFASKPVRADKTVTLEHGEPLVFGKDRERGIRLNGLRPEVVELGTDFTEADLIVHDETRPDTSLANVFAEMGEPDYPIPLGVFRAVERPTYENLLEEQVTAAKEQPGAGDLDALLNAGDTWVVE